MQEVFILKLAKELRNEHKRMGSDKLHHLITRALIEHGSRHPTISRVDMAGCPTLE